MHLRLLSSAAIVAFGLAACFEDASPAEAYKKAIAGN